MCSDNQTEEASPKSFQKIFPHHATKEIMIKKCKEARNIIYEAKKTSWKTFLSELGPQTPEGKVWKFFPAMEGSIPSSAIHFSMHKDEPLNKFDCAGMPARHYKGKNSNSIILDNE